MSLVVGSPFGAGGQGYVVGADRAATGVQDTTVRHDGKKLVRFGDRVVSLVGVGRSTDEDGFRWSLLPIAEAGLVNGWDDRVVASVVARSLAQRRRDRPLTEEMRQRMHALDTFGTRLTVWRASGRCSFLLGEDGSVQAEHEPTRPDDPHGAALEGLVAPVNAAVGAGKLRPSSYRLRGRTVRAVTETEARGLVRDILETAARATPYIGPPFDVEILRAGLVTTPEAA